MAAESRRTWKSLVHDVVKRQRRYFKLADVLRYADELRAFYPANRFVEAKIRQSLQVLRDQGVLRFLGAGEYERLETQPIFSPFFDPTLAAGYTNRAQVARVLIETWAEMNLYCLRCAVDALERLPPNTPVADFLCPGCSTRYQLKSKDGRIGSYLLGAAYDLTLAAVRAGEMPEYILVESDSRRSMIVYADAFPGSWITEERVMARTELGPMARRAGWRGCRIDISGLPTVAIVQPAAVDRVATRSRWREVTTDAHV